jgi:hypothetical protein
LAALEEEEEGEEEEETVNEVDAERDRASPTKENESFHVSSSSYEMYPPPHMTCILLFITVPSYLLESFL